MRILPESGGGAFCLLIVFVLCSAVHSLGRDVEVVGYAESSKIKIPHAFSGLRVTIECKAGDSKGQFSTRGSGDVDEAGKFHLNVPHDMVGEDGNLKEACYAQLHSASGKPCPAHDGPEASKIVYLSKTGEKHVLGLKQKLKFSPEICTSKFFSHMPKFPLPPFKKPCPPKITDKPIYKPPVPIYKPPVVVKPKKPSPPKKADKPIYKPPVPIYKPPVVKPKKPCPPKKADKPIYKLPVVKPKKPCPPKKADKPIYKPPVPIHKPIYKPPVPIHKPVYKPPVPIQKPIYKPPVPIYKPPVVIPKKPCPPKAPVPIYKPPVVVIPKKPCPPFPKFPKFPPKYIPDPKFGKWPPFPSHP